MREFFSYWVLLTEQFGNFSVGKIHFFTSLMFPSGWRESIVVMALVSPHTLTPLGSEDSPDDECGKWGCMCITLPLPLFFLLTEPLQEPCALCYLGHPVCLVVKSLLPSEHCLAFTVPVIDSPLYKLQMTIFSLKLFKTLSDLRVYL